ncbi:PilZ domain-containing protein [Candidatus Thiothrix anitrata]|jgi:type IV pilus assembly protein PilZ|uniref:PilZ domain-containing protein n=1 Tax=Candidatus Thiothrix anitrata TaxID=2823902 RepID=A0ABX7X0T9_9GAMM|nr:PilZ domain-containing protein [Candidatus Thiothrix anitrata]QTR49216.1 PilZ domain-containing protein [Candidatus Thiothrix anitrata]
MEKPGSGSLGSNVNRNLSLTVTDKHSLHAAYMPFIKNGGIFVPTHERFSLHDDVVLQLRLIEEGKRLLIPGKVVWITGVKSQRGTPAGVGLQFTGEQQARIRQFLEEVMGDLVKQPAQNPTY